MRIKPKKEGPVDASHGDTRWILGVFYYFLVAEYFVIQFIWSTLNEYSIFVAKVWLFTYFNFI